MISDKGYMVYVNQIIGNVLLAHLEDIKSNIK